MRAPPTHFAVYTSRQRSGRNRAGRGACALSLNYLGASKCRPAVEERLKLWSVRSFNGYPA